MLESPIFWGIISLVVTIGGSTIGIMKHKSAKKERIKVSHESILSTLFFLLVKEKRVPTKEEITKLGQLKCKENNIKLSDLPAEKEYLDLIYAKTLESKIIDKKIREELLNLFKDDMKQTDENEEKEILRKEKILYEESNISKKIILLSGLFAVVSSLILFFIFGPKELTINPINIPNILTLIETPIYITVFAILTVMILQIFSKLRNVINGNSLSPFIKSRVIEQELEKLAKKKGYELTKRYNLSGKKKDLFYFDYCLLNKDIKYLIEIVDSNSLVGLGSSRKIFLLNKLAETSKNKKDYKLILLVSDVNQIWINKFTKIKGKLPKWDLITTMKYLKSKRFSN